MLPPYGAEACSLRRVARRPICSPHLPQHATTSTTCHLAADRNPCQLPEYMLSKFRCTSKCWCPMVQMLDRESSNNRETRTKTRENRQIRALTVSNDPHLCYHKLTRKAAPQQVLTSLIFRLSIGPNITPKQTLHLQLCSWPNVPTPELQNMVYAYTSAVMNFTTEENNDSLMRASQLFPTH